ncbi:F-box only protein 21 isoform X2 [Pangasianodon hypophthalmus]|uniref:F-box only protein 21 isoform X2 n=1 Tax=Pangasianodon hypophthalmus TaxID=310915 RepID=UPI00230754D4|nr:F-box only protein 21 isoform X2 [Pangasianodon hypophthalmus]
MATPCTGGRVLGTNSAISESCVKNLTDLPTELLEYILCFPVLNHVDISNVSCCCKRLHEVCHGSGKVWGHQYKLRWPRLQKLYRQNESYDWQKEFRARLRVCLQIQRTVVSISKRFFAEVSIYYKFSTCVCLSFRKSLTLKYYAKKILYFLRQQNILRSLKVFLERPPEQQSALEGAVLVDQYCNPLADVTLESISAQLDDITEKVKKYLRVKNASHPSLRSGPGDCVVVQDFELQRQVLCALNAVLYEQLQFKGNECDYYNPMNSYIHQVLLRRTGIPISLSVLYMTLARKLGVLLEPVNFPNHFLLRWCQRRTSSDDISDYVYIDAFGKGKQLTAKECEYLIRQQVTADYYSSISTTELLLRMVGNLLNIGKRGEGSEKSYQLLRDSLDLYLTIDPDNVQYLLLQARLYFHLGIWPEKVLDILQHIQALDPSQHGAVGYLVQHTLEHIQHKRHAVEPEVKRRSAPEHSQVQYSVGLIMKHKRSGYNCVIYGWDPKCSMSPEWIATMRVHQLTHGANQPFYNVLVQDGTCRYAAQENLEPHSAPLEISHPEVGRYFSDFSDTHYMANEELQSHYPEDTAETQRAVRELYHSHGTDSGHAAGSNTDHDTMTP